MNPFRNEPLLELRRAPERARLDQALTELDATLPLRVPVLIGEDRRDGDALRSTDPGAPDRIVATAPLATADDARAAVEAARRAFPAWAATSARERAGALLAAASWMRTRRTQLAALCVRECAKPWPEADADVAEAIDFLEYYAREAVALDQQPPPLVQVPGERNTMRYVPRGVCAVIAPWNFPLAIPTGMTAAALATGNTVVLKPAEQAPGCGRMVVDALRAGGVPPSALALLPGEGEAGAALAAHPDVVTIAFTGSGAVGLELLRQAAAKPPRAGVLTRVVAEMGGKNCVLVDADADLDDAVPAIVHSAFAYAGQKCSAAARVLAHEAVADALLERLAGAVDVVPVGQASEHGTVTGPVVEQAAQQRVAHYTDLARTTGRIVATGDAPGGGWFAPPVLATDLPADSPVLHEEIFGPLLAVERVRDLDEACARVDALPFALTGGLFARNPRTIAKIVDRSPVGNLYVNRGITGAMVGRQPFGGNRLSGTGTKAGGPGYLLHFVEPRVVTENTMRHGLVVD